jgi:osmotically-inducible protein OsmY
MTTAPTDAAITQAVKEKLSQQPETSTANIAVDTHEGVVTLSGTVKSMQEKDQGHSDRRGTQGVQRSRGQTVGQHLVREKFSDIRVRRRKLPGPFLLGPGVLI